MPDMAEPTSKASGMTAGQFANLLRQHVRGYIPGSKLPGRDALARRFNVTTRVATEAIATLVHEGLVEVQPRHEPVVLERTGRTLRPIHRIVAITGKIRRFYDFQQTAMRGADRCCANEQIQFCEHGGEPDLARPDCLADIAGDEMPVTGWMFINTLPPDQSLLAWRVQRIPFVLVDDRSRAQPTASVGFDVQRTIFDATETLILLGHRRLAYLGDLRSNDSVNYDRRRGFELAMARHGLRIDPHCFWHDESGVLEDPVRTLQRDLPGQPDVSGIVAADVRLGCAALAACEQLNLAVPGRISVISGGATPRMAPPQADRLSRFDQGSPEQLGEAAVRVLLNSTQRPEPVQVLLSATWRDLGSVARRAAANT